MWQTPKGNKFFNDHFGVLIARCLSELIASHYLAKDRTQPGTLGVKAFDSLTVEQQLYVFHEIGNAILRPDIPAPPLTAYREAAVEAVFRTLFLLLEIDVDNKTTEIRSLTLSAYQERYYSFGPVLTPQTGDMEEWGVVVGNLSGLLLAEEDYEFDGIADLPPDKSQQVYSKSGLPSDYFTAFPPDPSTEEANQLAKDLFMLTEEVIRRGAVSDDKPV